MTRDKFDKEISPWREREREGEREESCSDMYMYNNSRVFMIIECSQKIYRILGQNH